MIEEENEENTEEKAEKVSSEKKETDSEEEFVSTFGGVNVQDIQLY